MGGLGNQFFQYALARGLATYSPVGIDISFYASKDNNNGVFIPREFGLHRFNCTINLADYDLNTQEITENIFDPEQRYQDCNFWGWWQRTKYFDYANIYKDLQKDLILKEEYLKDNVMRIVDEMNNCNSVAIHVRRTDYVKMNWQTDVYYYVRAKEKMDELVKDPKYYVFSDNIDWCYDNLPFKGARFIHCRDFEDFHIMQHAKHNIIANSTFSWWAAYTNKNKNIVVAPKGWISGIEWSPLSVKGWILV